MAVSYSPKHSSAQPKTAKDLQLGTKHLNETIKFNTKKMNEHLRALKQDGYSKEYNHSHAKGHQKDIAKEKKQLRQYRNYSPETIKRAQQLKSS